MMIYLCLPVFSVVFSCPCSIIGFYLLEFWDTCLLYFLGCLVLLATDHWGVCFFQKQLSFINFLFFLFLGVFVRVGLACFRVFCHVSGRYVYHAALIFLF